MTKIIKEDSLEDVNSDRKENFEYLLFESDYKRKENFKSHFARILIFFLYLASAIVIGKAGWAIWAMIGMMVEGIIHRYFK